jgi:hypothetical protein
MPKSVSDTRPILGRLLALATLAAAPFVLMRALTGMAVWDDEGALLAGFRSLREGHRMYDEIYSLYGPLYNCVYGLAYVVLHVPLTHTACRLIAAVLWLAYTAGFAAFCHRLTGSVATTLLGYVLVLFLLVELMDSPGHPEELCLLLLAAALLLACSLERAPSVPALVGLGVAVAGLALVKINVGAFVGGGLALVLLRVTVPSVWTRIALPAVVAGLLVLPAAVQALLFDFAWVRLYCLFSTMTIAAALLVERTLQLPVLLRPADWWVIVAAGMFTCVGVVGGMMLAGSSAYGILDAAVLQNARFIRNWYQPLELDWPGLLAPTISVLAALAFRLAGQRPRMRRFHERGILALKFAFVLLGGILFFGGPKPLFRVLVPFCWLLMVPPAGVQPRQAAARVAGGLIGAMMSLYPFPVAGHQINIGALLPVMMVPILAHDVYAAMLSRAAGGRLEASRLSALAVAIVLGIGTGATLRFASASWNASWNAYWNDTPLGLRGTSLIRIDPERAKDLRWVTAQLSSCGSSYSLPGMLSFAFWTGHALLTTQNINDVLAFIPPERQERIVEALSRAPDLCVVYNPKLLRIFDRGQIRSDPPLLHFILADFVQVAERHGYVILRRRRDR